MKIETAIRLITRFRRQREDRQDFPIDADPAAQFAVSEHGVIQSLNAVRGAEVVIDPKVGLLNIRASVKCHLLRGFVFEARRRQDGVEHPLASYFPAQPSGWDHRELALDVHAHSENELNVWIINISDH